ncbi:MAG TPA: galactose ABC transporter substrate-binding protein, partial [Dysgonamonadaceae bacterium]|nr:galactose ABC transporter substrate-binding protein [Dysgonamonadaceae bacterium]
MKKRILSLLLMLVMVLGVASCGGTTDDGGETAQPDTDVEEPVVDDAEEPADTEEAAEDTEEPAEKEKIRVGVLVWKYDDTYGSTVRQAIEKYAKELGDAAGVEIELDMQDGKDDQATQNDQATVMLANEPDVMVVNLVDVAAGQSIIDMIKPYEIPTIFYNKEPTDSAVITEYSHKSIFIGTDIAQAGVMQGDLLSKIWEENPQYDRNGDGVCQYLMFQGEPNNPEAIARTEYSVKQAEEQGMTMDLVNGEIIVANWDTASAQDQMNATWANLGDQIEAIFCNNDDMALGVIAALNGVGWNLGDDPDKFIPIIGVDATDAAMEAMSAGTMAGSVKQDGDAMGKAIIEIALNAGLAKDFLEGTDYEIYEDGYS